MRHHSVLTNRVQINVDPRKLEARKRKILQLF